METNTSPTNSQVADRIGLTHSAVSRIRSGQRLPSIPVMQAIEREYGWSIQDQVHAREGDCYPGAFEKAISK